MATVRAFGAVGDGKADDTSALQHAVDEGEGVLELGKGTYRITRPIVLDLTRRGYLGVRGDQGTARLVMNGPGPALQIVGAHRGTAEPKSVQPHTWDGERMPVVTGIEILGRHQHADGIQLIRTLQASIQHVLIRQCRVGIHLAERNRNFLLSAAHIYDCSDTGVFFDDCNLHQVIITGNHISYCRRAGIRQFDGDVHNVQITGNDIEYNSGEDGASGEIVLEAPNGIISEFTISGNTLQATREARGANVLILGRTSAPPTHVRLINITGNVIGSRQQNVVIHNGSQISVTGNTIYDGTELNVTLANCQNAVLGSNSIATRPAGYRSETVDGVLLERCVNCSVVGNVLNDSRFGNRRDGGGITLRSCRHVSVTACQILDPELRGIDVIDSSRCRISDNSVMEQRDVPTMLAAIRVTGDGRQNLVQSNMVTKGTHDAIDCDSSHGKVEANTVWD